MSNFCIESELKTLVFFKQNFAFFITVIHITDGVLYFPFDIPSCIFK